MAAKRKRSRLILGLIATGAIVGVLSAALWPRVVLVDLGEVRRGAIEVTIDEEGRTRVREPYVVSSPVAGELQRVSVLPGEKVLRGETIVARMRPANPSALDVRTREQARAAVNAAAAALRVSEADLNAAQANLDYAESEFKRMQSLLERGTISRATLERAEQEARVARASVETMSAAIEMRQAELNNARAQLIGMEDRGLASALAGEGEGAPPGIPLRAPIDGTILQVFHKSKTTLPAGEPILEIGDVAGDLEVMAELLSSDAVQVAVGDRVRITNWGGGSEMAGKVIRVDPYGYTKVSALGVEEQRVETTIRFEDAPQGVNLGHGYRVEVRIVVWEAENAVIVPSSALFRQGSGWAVFRVVDARVQEVPVDLGQNNGVEAEVLDGLQPGDAVVLFPSPGLSNGIRVSPRRID